MEESKENSIIRAIGFSEGKNLSVPEKNLKLRKKRRNRRDTDKEPVMTSLYSVVLSAGLAFLLAWLFFHSVSGCAFTFPAAIASYLSQRRKKRKRRMEQRRSQCKDGFLAIASALTAGYALENAIIQAKQELIRIWGENSYITDRWKEMECQIRLHVPIEQIFEQFSIDSNLDEVKQMTELLSIAKRSGGKLSGILKSAAGQMQEKMAVEMEIQTQITEKRLELQIMLLVPLGILFYLQMFSYETVKVLYTTEWGRLFMLGCLGIYGLGWWIGQKILQIEV